MIAIDTNILVYAHRPDVPFHSRATAAMRPLVEGQEPWAIAWPCIHEFFGVVTNSKVWPQPSTAEAALAFIDTLVNSPFLRLISEGPGYLPILEELVIDGNVVGPRVHDARIAAICLYHGVQELWSVDRDFLRFPKLRVRNPL